ncbi:MAG: hypothetical protein ACHREM_21590 [Polyangiales bacterium]
MTTHRRSSTSLARSTGARGERGHSRARWLALFVGGLAGATTSIGAHERAAFAAKPGTVGAVDVEVLAFSSNDAVEEAAALTDAFHHALVASPTLYDAGKSRALEAVALAIGCDDPMVPACAPKLAAALKSERFVYGVVKKTPPNRITVTLAYYDATQSKTGPLRTTVKTYEASPVSRDGASPELARIAQELLMQLVAGHVHAGVEVIVSGPAATQDSQLQEDGKVIATVTGGRATVELNVGKHHLELFATGFATSVAEVDVGVDGAHADFAPVSMAPAGPTDWKLYEGIGFAGVGLAFFAIGMKESLDLRAAQTDPTFTTYRRRWPNSVDDTCSQAQNGAEGPNPASSYAQKLAPTVADFCSSNHTKQLLQWVFYGLGVAGMATGGYLIWTDLGAADAKAATTPSAPTAPTATLRIAPLMTTSFGGVSLTGSF